MMQSKLSSHSILRIAIGAILAASYDNVFAVGAGDIVVSDRFNTTGSTPFTAQQPNINGNNATINIDLSGRRAGGNAFIPFDKFQVPSGTVTFDCSANNCGGSAVNNLIASVRNTNPNLDGGLTLKSVINGKIDFNTDNNNLKNTNLWLLNASGVLIGKGAVIDVPGAFHVGTTNVLALENGSQFDLNTTAGNVSTLTSSPSAFVFDDNATANIEIGESGTTGAMAKITAGSNIEINAGTKNSVNFAGGTSSVANTITANGNGTVTIVGGALVVSDNSRTTIQSKDAVSNNNDLAINLGSLNIASSNEQGDVLTATLSAAGGNTSLSASSSDSDSKADIFNDNGTFAGNVTSIDGAVTNTGSGIITGKATAQGGDLNNSGQINGGAQTLGSNDIVNSGSITGAVVAGRDIENSNSIIGNLTSGRDIVNSGSITGNAVSTRDIENSGSITGNRVTGRNIDNSGSITLNGSGSGAVQATNDLILNGNGTSSGVINIVNSQYDEVTVSAGNDLTLGDTQAGVIKISGNGTADTNISAGGELSFNGESSNIADSASGAGDLNVNVGNDNLTVNGNLTKAAGTGKLNVEVAGNLINQITISGNATAGESLTNEAIIGGNATAGSSLNNQANATINGKAVAKGGDLTNRGTIHSGAETQGSHDVINHQGASINGNVESGRDIDNAGLIQLAGQGSGRVHAARDLIVTGDGNNGGIVRVVNNDYNEIEIGADRELKLNDNNLLGANPGSIQISGSGSTDTTINAGSAGSGGLLMNTGKPRIADTGSGSANLNLNVKHGDLTITANNENVYKSGGSGKLNVDVAGNLTNRGIISGSASAGENLTNELGAVINDNVEAGLDIRNNGIINLSGNGNGKVHAGRDLIVDGNGEDGGVININNSHYAKIEISADRNLLLNASSLPLANPASINITGNGNAKTTINAGATGVGGMSLSNAAAIVDRNSGSGDLEINVNNGDLTVSSGNLIKDGGSGKLNVDVAGSLTSGANISGNAKAGENLTNNGTIDGNATASNGNLSNGLRIGGNASAGALLTNDADATITGKASSGTSTSGVNGLAADGLGNKVSLINRGTIAAGAESQNGTDIDNQKQISGNVLSVKNLVNSGTITENAEAYGTLSNSGKIDGYAEAASNLTNTETGTIGQYAKANNGTLTNSGKIDGYAEAASNLTNSETGTIGQYAKANNGTLTNSGKIDAYAEAKTDLTNTNSGTIGQYAKANNGTLTNEGKIDAYAEAASNLTNTETGTIGQYAKANNGTLTNSGKIDGYAEAKTDLTNTNSGTIGQYAKANNGTLTNAGTIGSDSAVDYASASGKLTNSGTINGSASSKGDLENSGNIGAYVDVVGDLENQASGIIRGNVDVDGDLLNQGQILIAGAGDAFVKVGGNLAVDGANARVEFSNTGIADVNVHGQMLVDNGGVVSFANTGQARVAVNGDLKVGEIGVGVIERSGSNSEDFIVDPIAENSVLSIKNAGSKIVDSRALGNMVIIANKAISLSNGAAISRESSADSNVDLLLYAKQLTLQKSKISSSGRLNMAPAPGVTIEQLQTDPSLKPTALQLVGSGSLVNATGDIGVDGEVMYNLPDKGDYGNSIVSQRGTLYIAPENLKAIQRNPRNVGGPYVGNNGQGEGYNYFGNGFRSNQTGNLQNLILGVISQPADLPNVPPDPCGLGSSLEIKKSDGVIPIWSDMASFSVFGGDDEDESAKPSVTNDKAENQSDAQEKPSSAGAKNCEKG